MTMIRMLHRYFPILILAVLGSGACVHSRQNPTAAATPATSPETPVKRGKLFGSSEVQPEGNSALHYIDARLYELRDQDQSTVDSLKLALQKDPDSSYLHGEMARNLAQSNQFEQGALEVQKALQLDPGNANLHLLAGKLLSVRQQSDAAVLEYEKCLKLKPDLEECYTMLAREHALQKRNDKALATIKRLLRVDPGSIEGLYYLGTLYTGDPKKTREAIQAFKDILHEDPDDMKALASLTQIYLDQKMYPEALKILLRIEHLAPHDIPIKLRIGLIYYEMKDYDLAIERFNKALQLSPQNDRVSYYLGLLEAQRKNYQKALSYFENVPTSSDLYKESVLRIALVYQEMNQIPQAIQHVQKSLRVRKDVPDLYELLGTLYGKEGNYAKGIAAVDQGLKRFPNQERLLFGKGVLLDKQGEFEKSIEVMRQLLVVNPQNTSALNYIGYSYADRGMNLKEAVEMLSKANELKPDDGYILDSLGWAYFKAGNREKALQLLHQANKLSPNEPVILEHLGDVYLNKGEKEKARGYFRDAVAAAIGEEHPEAREVEDLKRIQSKLADLSPR